MVARERILSQEESLFFVLPPHERQVAVAPKDATEAVDFFGHLLADGDEEITDQMLDRLSRVWQATVDLYPKQRNELEAVRSIIAAAQEAYHERTGRNIAGAFDLRTNHAHPR